MTTRGVAWLVILAFSLGVLAAGAGAWVVLRGAGPRVTQTAAPTLYHCPMHPTIVSDRPGDCPICGMRLIPTDRHAGPQGPATAQDAGPAGGAATEGPPVEGLAPVHLTIQKRQLIGVTSQPAVRGPLTRTIRTIGRVTYDETRLHHVHTKVGGYVERLFANATGELVHRGQPLLTIYSPELLASTQEYLLALRARDRLMTAASATVRENGEGLVESARRRLLLFDLTAAQIDAVEKTGEAPRTVTLSSPVTGHIVMRNVLEGQKIESGMTLLDIANLDRVWMMADVYEYELPFVRMGQKATMTLSYVPDRTFEGRVSLISPVVSEATRTVKVRVELDNPGLLLKPEMFADVQLFSDLGTGIVVPAESVISTGERDVIFVDAGDGRYDPREVRLGVRLDDTVQIVEGVLEGERVVTSGNFLLDSESKLKAAIGAAAERPGHAH